MRKWALRIGTFLLSLIVGYASSFVWNARHTITLCDIHANPLKYAGIVRLRVVIFKDVLTDDVTEYTPQIQARSVCAGSGFWSWASVDLDEGQISLLRENKHSLRSEGLSREEKYYVTEAILVGRFEPPVGITGCFGPKYRISEARIERVIANHEFESKEQLAQWIESQSR